MGDQAIIDSAMKKKSVIEEEEHKKAALIEAIMEQDRQLLDAEQIKKDQMLQEMELLKQQEQLMLEEEQIRRDMALIEQAEREIEAQNKEKEIMQEKMIE